ncbi:MAG TPA: DNA methyltransferase, partial [Gemmataceae bacterium]|nr:DNA methyltransferase [Gemmataceae bacterium]
MFASAEITDARLDIAQEQTPSSAAAHALSWLSLVSGEFFREPRRASFFDHRKAADRLLLENLREVRRQLHEGDDRSERPPLDYDTIHDLLARLMFMQFLADRRDEGGRAALNPEFLEQRRSDGTLSQSYPDFCGVLESKTDTYRLFGWLNHKFNGDLFPNEAERGAEERRVDPSHLRFLASFIKGDIALRQGQRLLWKHYSFDVIPLEFISSIYEEFVRRGDADAPTGVVYTPGHLVDFILDGVLPWDESEWKVTILDPACGSGIFLVKAYQRLVHRWKVAHPSRRPSADTLRGILEERLFGIDTEEGAVRVASFSLYLAMCDEIDPKRYWTSVRFPRLRGQNIRRQDFLGVTARPLRCQGEEGLTGDEVTVRIEACRFPLDAILLERFPLAADPH